MGIYIFSDKAALIKDKFSKTVKIQSLAALSKFSPGKNDNVFLDISGIEGVEIKEILSQVINKDKTNYSGTEGTKFLSSNIKLPSASMFPGWKKMKSGMSMPFYLLYCSIEGKTQLDSRFNEKIVSEIHKQFVELLKDNFEGSDGLLWMNTGRDCLLLIPPKQKNIEAAIKSCFRMLVSAPLSSLEYFDVTMPLNFIFALHYGTIKYKPPGQTGTVVSDAINFIFHLGSKKAEMGRLTLSGELPGVSVPKQLQDCFVSTKDFEGRKIWQSRKFEYPKPWV